MQNPLLFLHVAYDVVDGGNGVAVTMTEEVEDVADGLLLFYLLVNELVDEVDGGAVVLGISHVSQFVNLLCHPHLVLQRALEDVLRVLEVVLRSIDSRYLGLATTVQYEVGHLQGVLLLFVRVVEHPVGKTFPTLLAEPEGHLEIEV